MTNTPQTGLNSNKAEDDAQALDDMLLNDDELAGDVEFYKT